MLLATLYCLFAPLPLGLLEQFLPYPYFIEEVFKYFLIRSFKDVTKWYFPILYGIIFSISESIFYLANFFQLGNFYLLPLRLLLTTLLHSLTFSLLFVVRKSYLLSFLVLFLSIAIHYFYNQFFSQF